MTYTGVPPTTPRRWFQFHLVTAVVVMIAAGASIAFEPKARRDTWGYMPKDQLMFTVEQWRGYPYIYWSDRFYYYEDGRVTAPSGTAVDKYNAVLDAAFVMAVLIAVAFTTEFIVRRSAARARGVAT